MEVLTERSTANEEFYIAMSEHRRTNIDKSKKYKRGILVLLDWGYARHIKGTALRSIRCIADAESLHRVA